MGDKKIDTVNSIILDARFCNGKLVYITKDDIYIDNRRIKKDGLFGIEHFRRLFCDDNNIYIGTSFSGVLRLKYGEYKFSYLNKGLLGHRHSKKRIFYDEILAITKGISSDYPIFVFTSYSYAIFLFDKKNGAWKRVLLEKGIPKNYVINIGYKKPYIFFLVYKDNKFVLYKGIFNRKKWMVEKIVPISKKIQFCYKDIICLRNRYINVVSKKIKERIRINNLRGVYIPPRKAVNKRYIRRLIPRLKAIGMNAVVLDVKDDSGIIHFSLSLPRRFYIKKAFRFKKYDFLLPILKKYNFYIIGRVVSFKDIFLFQHNNHRYAILNIITKKPWRGLSKEYWVDPYSKFVWDYLLAIVLGMEKIGFSEVQFDYIRFPSDGPIRLCYFRYNNINFSKRENLKAFLEYIRKNTSLPMSIDIYGYNGMYKIGGFIGQDIEELISAVDRVSPMIYPSHYGIFWLREYKGYERIYRIVDDAIKRFVDITQNKGKLRPFLQAFPMGKPAYNCNYLLSEMKAIKENNITSYLFWNAKGDYKTLISCFSHQIQSYIQQ